MIKRPLKFRSVPVLALLTASVLALTLSACGSADDASTSTSAGPEELTKVTVGNFGMLPAAMDMVWGVEGGFFKKHGLDVTLAPPQASASDLANLVVNGQADVAIISGTVVPSARRAGRELKLVATTQIPVPLNFAFSPAADKKLRDQGLSEDSSAKELLAALKGLTLAVPPAGSSITAVYRYLLAQYGINPERDNITLSPMPDSASQIAALANGRVDAIASALGGPTAGAKAQGAGVIWNLAAMKGSEALQAIPSQSVMTTEKTIKDRPELIQAFLDAYYETQQALVKGLSPEDAASLKELLGAKMDPTLYNETISGVEQLFPDSYVTSDASWDALRKVAEINTNESLNIPAAEGVDNSFAEKVKK